MPRPRVLEFDVTVDRAGDAHSALGGLAWAQIFIANLIAAGLMIGYLWRTHPQLSGHLRHALEGTDD